MYDNFSGSKLMKWARGLMEYVPVPMEILMYREKLGLGKVNEKEKMPIGDFTIELENVRLGLLFQS